MKSLFAFLAAAFCAQALAMSDATLLSELARPVMPSLKTINWNIGDSADYNMAGGLINGTMHMFVREATPQGYWMQQDLSLGFLGEHKIESLIDKESGKILDMIVDGNKQAPPDPNDSEIVDSHRDQVTVPKGTFDCMWVKLHDKKENTDSQSWINPLEVPIAGLIKAVTPSRMGEVTIELTDFHRN